MSGSQFDFLQLIAPLQPDTFFSDYWESRPLFIARQQPDYYDGLLTRRDVDGLLSPTELGASTIEVVQKQQAREARRKRAGRDGNLELDELYRAYQQGATLEWTYLDQRWPPVAALCQSMERALSGDLGALMFLTPKGSQGFSAHYDRYHFFVLQLSGSKQWRIYDSPVPYPRSGARTSYRSVLGEVLLEPVLNPGDLLYLPRGYLHEAWTSETDALSINIGVQVYTWYDLLFEALEALDEQEPRFRKALPAGFTERADLVGALQDEFDGLLHEFAARASLPEAVRRLVERFVWYAHAPLDGYFSDVAAAADLTLESVLCKRPTIPYRIFVSPDSATLLFPKRKLKGPRYIEEALRFIAQADQFEVRNLPDSLTNQGKLVLVRRLVREGFLTVVPNPVQGAPHVAATVRS